MKGYKIVFLEQYSFDKKTFINIMMIAYAFFISFPVEIIRPFAIILILFLLVDRKNKIELPEIKVFLFFGIFLSYIILSFAWSEASVNEAIYYLRRYWYFIPAFVLYKYIEKENIKFMITAFLSGIFISEILSYGNFFAFWQIGHGNSSDPTVFMQHSLYGVFLTVTALFLLFKLVYEKRDLYWYLTLCFFITVTINLFVNSGRTGYFTFLLALITLVVILNLKDIKKLLKYGFMSIIFIFTIFTLAYNTSSNFNQRLNQIVDEIIYLKETKNYNRSIGARIGFWIVTKDIILEDPILGVGIGNQNNVKKKIIDEKYGNSKSYVKRLEHFHNVHLEILASYGIVGYGLFLAVLSKILLLKIKDKIINALKYIVVFSFLYSSLADNVFYLSHTISLFALILGIVLAQYKIEWQEEKNEKINNAV